MTQGTAEQKRLAAWPKYISAATREDIRDRLFRHVRVSVEGCWEWQSALNGVRYPLVVVHRKTLLAHRLALLVFRGEFDPRCDVDHLCRNSVCVNPDHLEAVSHRENVQRGESFGRVRDTCRNGHPYVGVIRETHGRLSQRCLVCDRDRQRKFRALRAA